MQILQQLIAPCGLVWLGLILAGWFAWRSGKRLLLACNLTLLLAYTLLGSPWVAQTLLSRLNSDYSQIDSFGGEPYDVVCVLGGATFESPHGKAQLASAGDRVMLGARLYLTGRTKLLVGTGGDGSSRGAAKQYAEIWHDLAIPQADIILLRGSRTSEEIDEIGRAAHKHGWKRIGLVTSAPHMRRAMSYANARNLNLHPLPAAVSRGTAGWNFREHTVPQAKGFLGNQIAIKEMLGAVIQRIGVH